MDKNLTKKVGNLDIYTNKELGKGTYGKVYQGMNTQTGQLVAVKMISKNIVKDGYLINAIKNQIKLMMKIKSPHVVGLKCFLTTANNIYLAQELCDGDLTHYLKNRKERLTQKQAIQIFQQLLLGFYALIVTGTVHRDLKPDNVLYKGEVFKLCDFGLAKIKNKSSLLTTQVGTLNFQSPQQIKGELYGEKCDIWALGCIFYQLLYNRFFVSDHESKAKIMSEFELQLPKKPEISEHSKQILRKCLRYRQQDRADWNFLFEHPIFQNRLPSIKNLKYKLSYILSKIRSQVTEENIDLQIFFEKFKKDEKCDQLTYDSQLYRIGQFSKMLLCLVPDLDESEIRYIFWNFDEDGDDKISLTQFLEATKDQLPRQSVKPSELFRGDGLQGKPPSQMEIIYQKLIDASKHDKITEIHNKFVGMDQKNQGLNRQMFANLCLSICPEFTDKQLELLFKKFDDNNDNSISYGQFYTHLCKVVGMVPRSIVKGIKLVIILKNFSLEGEQHYQS